MKISLKKKIIFWGGTGQSKVNRAVVECHGAEVAAVFDDTLDLRPPFGDVPLYHGWAGFLKWAEGKTLSRYGFCVCIGNPYGQARLDIADRLKAQGLTSVTLIHPSAVIAKGVVLGEGCQVMAGAVIQTESKIGKQCIINTCASVDHECCIADGCEVAPGAVLCGDVRLGPRVWVGAGAVVLPRIVVGADAVIGAGAVVTRSVPARATVVGVPALPLKKKSK